MVPDLLQAVRRQLVNESDVGLLDRAVNIGVGSLIGVALERLRVVALPGRDLLLVNPHSTVFDPRAELVQPLLVVVRADPRLHPVVPLVDAADEVVALDMAVGQQGSSMVAATVEDRNTVLETHDDEIDISDQGVGPGCGWAGPPSQRLVLCSFSFSFDEFLR